MQAIAAQLEDQARQQTLLDANLLDDLETRFQLVHAYIAAL